MNKMVRPVLCATTAFDGLGKTYSLSAGTIQLLRHQVNQAKRRRSVESDRQRSLSVKVRAVGDIASAVSSIEKMLLALPPNELSWLELALGRTGFVPEVNGAHPATDSILATVRAWDRALKEVVVARGVDGGGKRGGRGGSNGQALSLVSRVASIVMLEGIKASKTGDSAFMLICMACGEAAGITTGMKTAVENFSKSGLRKERRKSGLCS